MQGLTKLKQRLLAGVKGAVSQPGELAYEQTVSIWAKPKILPGLVVHCADVADVQLAVRSAQEMGVPLSVRGGGHDWTGRSLCQGLTLDLRRMNSVDLTRDGARVQVGGGVKGTHIYAVTDPAGVAPVLGSVADIGAVGLVTGGGYNPLMRRFGLACDNLHAATVVLADGRVTRAAEDGNEELFWALRGGGGNFGVVTSMELKVRPLESVRSGVLLFPFERSDAILPRLSKIWASAPRELDVQAGITPGPDGTPVLYLSPTWSGDPSIADAAIAPLYAIEGRIMADVHDQPFGASRTFFDHHIVNGRVTSMDSIWLREWNEEVTRIVVEAMRRRPSPLCFVLLHEVSGAATEVPASATPFGLRKPHIWFEAIAPADPDGGSDGTDEAAWARRLMEDLASQAFPGAYANLLGPCEPHRTRWAFGDNVSRLVAAKKRYDPDGLFCSAITLPDTSAIHDAE